MNINNPVFMILIVVYATITLKLSAQTTNTNIEIARSTFKANQVIPPSPEAAELGKYGNVPVSLFTGTPEISIPLVNLSGNVLSLAATLSYNAQGFKPEDIAPWTGLGWALNAGGVITRSVSGEPDGDDNYYISPSPLDPVPSDELAEQQYFLAIRDMQKEAQPDVYYFNFMGHSGKFLIRTDGSIFKKENDLLNIARWPGTDGEKYFIITDENGIRYEFSEMEKTTITPVDDQPDAPPLIIKRFVSSWYLSRVIAPYGNEEISFTYHAPANAQKTISNTLSNKSVTYSRVNDGSSNWEEKPFQINSRYFIPPSVSILKKFPDQAVLTKDGYQVGYITFESSVNERTDLGSADFDGERLLKKVKLYHTQSSVSTLIKQFELTYGYFGEGQPEAPGYRRLKLKTVQELSPNPSEPSSKPPYTFYYNHENDAMPARFISGLDHWGFYNGQTNVINSTPTLVPALPVSTQYLVGDWGDGADRGANAGAASYTLLNKITYPTGGYTLFEYEGHIATSWQGSTVNDTLVGGLRIKKITDYSFPGKPALIKRYSYTGDDGYSSGQYYSNINYVTSSVYAQTANCGMNPVTFSVTISANSVFGLGTVQGSVVGYKKVTEYSGAEGAYSPGKTVYRYSIRQFSAADDDIGNGDLEKKEVFDGEGVLLQETENQYSYNNMDMIVNRKIYPKPQQSDKTVLMRNAANDYVYYCPASCISPPAGYVSVLSVPTQYYAVNDYVFKQNKRLVRQTQKVFNAATGAYLTTAKEFTYANPQLNYPTLTQEVDSKGNKFFTSIKYVMDYTIPCSPQAGSMAAKLQEMKGKNMMALPVERIQYRQTEPGGARRYISGEFIEYRYGRPQKYYSLETSTPLTSVTPSEASCIADTQLIDPAYRPVASATYYPNYNLKEEWKTNDAVTCYFWGYHSRLPVAKVVGKTYAAALASGIDQAVLDNPGSDAALKTELNKLRALPDALVTTYTYNPGGSIASATEANGIVTTYEYDTFNRPVAVKDDEGSMTADMAYNYGLGVAPEISPVTLWYNQNMEQAFTKQSCSEGTYGELVVYRVAYGKYVSSVSQADANSKANADIAANGQAYANSAGHCGWKNAAIKKKLFRNNCTPEEGSVGGFIWYEVPFGKYFSTTSQADADAQAMHEVNTTGQQQANQATQCSCGGDNQKMINGSCETSNTKFWVGSAPNTGGGVICYYRYKFSDGSLSTATYSEIHSSSCPQNP